MATSCGMCPALGYACTWEQGNIHLYSIVATSCGMCPALGYACTVPGSRGIYRVLTVDLLTVLRTFIKLYDVHHFIDND